MTACVGAAAATVLFLPALINGSAFSALPYLIAAVFFLTLQNPAIAASQLDIMPPALWGRAESVRTFLRSLAMAIAPLLFGAVSDHVFGGGHSGLQWTFIVMLAAARRECVAPLQGAADVPAGRRDRRLAVDAASSYYAQAMRSA